MADIDIDRDEERVQKIIDFKETFEREHGKRTLGHLKKKAHYNEVIKPPRDHFGRIDSYEVVRRDAQRSVIVYIESMLNKDPYEKKGIKHE